MQQAKKDLADADAAPGCQEVQIWPIEVLLERARLAIACYNSERRDLDEGTSKKALQYLSEAEQILEKTMERVSQTEQRYKPLIQNWADVPRPKYLVAFSRATDVGYHRHNDEIEDLKTFIEQERMSD